jgi:hypothetical protein
LAYNLANFLRQLVLPQPIQGWTLTTLRKKLVKIGAKVVAHSRYMIFQLAVDKWQPQPPRRVTPSGLENMVVAAHLLGGGRLLTVNGMGQVVIWSLPTAAGMLPKQELFYDPPANVAKYPARLGLGLTALSADRKRLAIFKGNDGYFLLDTDGLKLHGVVKSPEDAKSVPNTVHFPLAAAFSPDGVQLAALFEEGPNTLGTGVSTPGREAHFSAEAIKRMGMPEPGGRRGPRTVPTILRMRTRERFRGTRQSLFTRVSPAPGASSEGWHG